MAGNAVQILMKTLIIGSYSEDPNFEDPNFALVKTPYCLSLPVEGRAAQGCGGSGSVLCTMEGPNGGADSWVWAQKVLTGDVILYCIL